MTPAPSRLPTPEPRAPRSRPARRGFDASSRWRQGLFSCGPRPTVGSHVRVPLRPEALLIHESRAASTSDLFGRTTCSASSPGRAARFPGSRGKSERAPEFAGSKLDEPVLADRRNVTSRKAATTPLAPSLPESDKTGHAARSHTGRVPMRRASSRRSPKPRRVRRHAESPCAYAEPVGVHAAAAWLDARRRARTTIEMSPEHNCQGCLSQSESAREGSSVGRTVCSGSESLSGHPRETGAETA